MARWLEFQRIWLQFQLTPPPVALMTSPDEEFLVYSRLASWGDLLNVVDDHSKTGPQEVLAVHASR